MRGETNPRKREKVSEWERRELSQARTESEIGSLRRERDERREKVCLRSEGVRGERVRKRETEREAFFFFFR